MSAAMIRTGGIMALLMVPTVLVFAFSMLAGYLYGLSTLGVAVTAWSLIAPLYFIFIAFAVFVFWTTRGLFKALGYAAADGCFVILIGLLVLGPPLVVLPWTWFSILATRFGRQVGSRLWQVVGVIYLVAMVLVAASAVSAAFNDYRWPNMELLGFTLAALLLGWVCHGIGLIVSARNIGRT